MKVSIVILTYNQSDYIDQAIQSALAQTYSNLEVIVSDDCSTDQTGNICKKYPTIRYFRNKENLGRVGNYHRALYHYASGDYVLMLDGDDYLIDNGYIDAAMKLISKNRNMVMVFARSKILFDNQKMIKTPKVAVLPARHFYLKTKS